MDNQAISAELVSDPYAGSPCLSSLAFLPGRTKQLANQDGTIEIWQAITIKLKSGSLTLATKENEDFLLCRAPADEMGQLIDNLKCLYAGKCEHFIFEPFEPSFSLCFKRVHHYGIKVEAWLDAGNASQGIHTFDALGIRFLTVNDQIALFLQDLEILFKRS